MWATISSMPSPASVTTAVTRPPASKRGENAVPSSSMCLSGDGSGKVGMTASWRSEIDRSEPVAARNDRGSGALAGPHHGCETNLLVRIVAERTGEGGGESGRPLLADPAHGHAHVLG